MPFVGHAHPIIINRPLTWKENEFDIKETLAAGDDRVELADWAERSRTRTLDWDSGYVLVFVETASWNFENTFKAVFTSSFSLLCNLAHIFALNITIAIHRLGNREFPGDSRFWFVLTEADMI